MRNAVLLSLALLASPAQAAELITINFSATTQPAFPSSTNPIPSHSGQFIFTLDGGATSLNEIDFELDGIVFTPQNAGITKIGDAFFLGGLLNGPESIRSGTNDFVLGFLLGNNGGSAGDFGYVLERDPAAFGNTSAPSINVVSRTPHGAVPEPSAWAMMLVGIFSVGFVMRRRRQKVTVSHA